MQAFNNMLTDVATLVPSTFPVDIPEHPVQLTTEWVTVALRLAGSIDHANVTSLRVAPMTIEGHTSQMVRVHIEYDLFEEDAPTSLIAKFPDADPELREALSDIYERELHFYGSIAGQLDLRTPRCYYHAMDVEQHKYILLIEDLSSAQPGDQIAGCSIAQAELAILSSAELHARFWNHPILDELPWLAPESTEEIETRQADFLQENWPNFLEKYGRSLPQIIVDVGELYCRELPAMRSQLSQTPVTLLHGDYRLDNLLFYTEEGRLSVAVVDWQLVKQGNVMIDVAYFLGWSVTTEMRRSSEMALLKSYHNALLEKGIRHYSFDQCLLDYRLAMVYPLDLLIAVLGGIDMSSGRRASLAATLIERMAATLQDLEI